MIDTSHHRKLKAGLVAAIAAAGALAVPTVADAATVEVTSGADGGEGSLRAAIDAANASTAVRRIEFADGLTVSLADTVEFSGSQPLTIDGNGSTVSAAGVDATDESTWDSGALVVSGTNRLTLIDLTVEDSFNNGIAVIAPAESSSPLVVRLDRVSVTGSKFHGVFIDAQASSGFNTDGDLHDACVDPFPVDSDQPVVLDARFSSVSGNGTLRGGYDDSLATGCPRDFDGVRVDQGGDGGLVANLTAGTFDGNLADGVELDETGGGDVVSNVWFSSFDGNGASGETIDGLSDLDDGFDIDEADGGNVIARVNFSSMDLNHDEGFDVDEAGDGNAVARLFGVRANGNEDEGLKVGEEDGGSVVFAAQLTESSASASQDGIELEEAGDGNVLGDLFGVTSRGNDNHGLKVTQADAGAGRVTARFGDLSGNGDDPVDAEGVVVTTDFVTL